MNCFLEAISLGARNFRSFNKRISRNSYDDIRWRQPFKMINYCFPKKLRIRSWRDGKMTDDRWWITLLSLNWILEQKLRRDAADSSNNRQATNLDSSNFVAFLSEVCPKNKTIFDNWGFRSQEQCSTNLNSTVILIMLVKLRHFFADRHNKLHWRNNRKSLSIRSSEIVCRFLLCLRQKPFTTTTISASICDRNPWMKTFVGHLKTGSFFGARCGFG